MRNYLLLLILLVLSCNNHYAQNIGINSTGVAASSSAILDISSTDKGLLIPVMSNTDRQLIKSPVNGLIIYNNSTNQINYYISGTGWYKIVSNSVSIISATGVSTGGVAINNTGSAPNNSTMLDISALDKGLLIPRTLQGNITTPVEGLIIYNTSTNTIDYYNGAIWISLCMEFIDNNFDSAVNTSQGTAINVSGTPPDPSAILDVAATNTGLLIPRMLSSQRDVINTPPTGLLIYNTTNQRMEIWTGNSWEELLYYPPPTPGIITGNSTPCQNSTNELYSINPVNGAITYTWTVPSGATITSGQNTTSITVNWGTVSGNISVTANNSCGMSTSSNLAIILNSSPSISSQPINATVCNGASATFSVVGSGTFQWQVSTDGGNSFNNITVSGVNPTYVNWNTASLNVNCVVPGNNGYQYRCIITGGCPTITSNTATLTIGSSSNTVFNYTGGQQIWIVPAGVTSILADVKGAQGGSNTGPGPACGGANTGGLGGRMQTSLNVTPGQTIYIYVGGSGNSGGFNGGGIGTVNVGNPCGSSFSSLAGVRGGGASDIRQGGTALSNRIAVAGGGGGTGGCWSGCANGGAGGGLIGGNGAQGNFGFGGTQTSGGAGCNPGSLGIGGNACPASLGGGGGGGGGGYYGGGGGSGGAGNFGGATGGGGSNYSSGSCTSHTSGVQNGNGQIIITWCF